MSDYITHFFVTAVHTGVDLSQDSPDVWSNKSSRLWGYTDTFDKADKDVESNYGDIHEGLYQWIVVEEHIMDTVTTCTGFIQWYHWDQSIEGYKKCDTPEWAKNIVHWGIG